MILKTKSAEFKIRWGGISDISGNLSFALTEMDLPSAFKTFSNTDDISEIEMWFDKYTKKVFEGYTTLAGVTESANGDIVVTLKKGDGE